MLAKKIRSLLNGGGAAAGPEGLQAAISEIEAEIAAQKKELCEIPAQRTSLALEDDAAAKTIALNAREEELYAQIEVDETRISALREKLRELINARRIDRIEFHRKAAAEVFEVLSGSLTAVVAANEAAVAAFALASKELGVFDANTLVGRGDYQTPYCMHAAVHHWQAAKRLEIQAAARMAPAAPAPKVSGKAPTSFNPNVKIPHGAGKGGVRLYQVPQPGRPASNVPGKPVLTNPNLIVPHGAAGKIPGHVATKQNTDGEK